MNNKKLKICVYAIAKNEEKFVERWYNSMKEADEIYVLDTGSSDNTIDKLKKLGVNVVVKEIKPWRFDVARNESLKLVPNDTDICVCTDLDEVFDKGWRKILENSWNDTTTKARYNYNWSLDKNNNPLVNFYIEKIHSKNGYKWVHPVHEVLSYKNKVENIITLDNITLNHYPDSTKSRSQYLPLLELSVKEDPLNDRNMHYLGREYMYYEKWNECIDTLIKHLNLKTATWKDERCASMRFIARSYKNLNRFEEAKMWYEKAIKEAPYLRDPFVEYAILLFELKDYEKVITLLNQALKITKNPKTYINESFCYDGTIYDLMSISLFYTNDIDNSLKFALKALEKFPDDERIKENVEIIKDKSSRNS
jgi:tetratricopeptide (TPR) repeat protein